ncbi:MAG: S1 RNA-binding domain-containing protein [bacterium]
MKTDSKIKEKTQTKNFKSLLEEQQNFQLPKVGDLVKGKVIKIGRGEVHLNVEGITAGVIRGYELFDESGEHTNLKVGNEIEATVLELENEKGEMELSLRFAGHQKAWKKLEQLREEKNLVAVQVIDANKGGLLVNLGKVAGFLPVSQLSTEHYPRVAGGDKNKILEKLKSYVGQKFNVKIIDVLEMEEKLIVSEKAAREEEQKEIISRYQVGDMVGGTATAVTDFGIFIKFGDNLEGLIHISEIAWQRIDHPKDLVKVGQKIKAQIIDISGSKIFLSMKKLVEDPWVKIASKYEVGQAVKGRVLKINPFGLFVQLDENIHGLAHISELSDKPIKKPEEVAKVGDELEFKILSIEPADHRLGLSIRALKEKKEKIVSAETEENEKEPKISAKKKVSKEEKETTEKK